MNYNVLDFGAVGDGVNNDTAAVQKAVDACGAAGGGVVTFPAGKYFMGKVVLHSYVTISLDSGARIIASNNEADYPPSKGSADSLLEGGMVARPAVFYGCELTGIVLRGPGEVDGNYKNILKPGKSLGGPGWTDYEKDLDIYLPNGFRPVLIMLEECDNVTIENIYLYDSPCYTMALHACTFMQIRGVRINNAFGAANADGIHMMSCSDVFIVDCDLTCGDDSIAIDTDEGKPAERFVISNCIISSRNNCFRIFHSLHNASMYAKLDHSKCRVRDIVITSCVIRQGDSFVCINSDYGEISNILVSDIRGTMTRNGGSFIISAHNNSKVDNVVFKDWSVKTRGAGYMYVEPGSSISNVSIRHYTAEVCPKTQMFCMGMDKMIKVEPTDRIGLLPFYWWSHCIPFFMQIINVESVELDDVSIYWGEEDLSELDEMFNEEGKKYMEESYEAWRVHDENYPIFHPATHDWPAIQLHDVKSVVTNRLKLVPHGNCKEAMIEYKNGEKQ